MERETFLEKVFWRRFCGGLISFHEVMKLQSLEIDTTDVIPANVQKHFIPGLCCIFLLILWKKSLLQIFTIV